MANGNGKVKPLEAVRNRTQFTPATAKEAGRKGGLAKEANLQGRMNETREAVIAAGPDAADAMVELLTTKGMVRYLAAKDILDRVLGQSKQMIEYQQNDEFTQRVDSLIAEMEALERADQEHASP